MNLKTAKALGLTVPPHVQTAARVLGVRLLALVGATESEIAAVFATIVQQRAGALTGCPVLVNTSFNIRSEPIVCTPQDAFRCFMGCGIDLLVVGRAVLHKHEQDLALRIHYVDTLETD